MRFLDLCNKEIVNLNNGDRLGQIIESDFLIDKETGKLISIFLPSKSFGFKLFGGNNQRKEVQWGSIKKIGYDLIIIETEEI